MGSVQEVSQKPKVIFRKKVYVGAPSCGHSPELINHRRDLSNGLLESWESIAAYGHKIARLCILLFLLFWNALLQRLSIIIQKKLPGVERQVTKL